MYSNAAAMTASQSKIPLPDQLSVRWTPLEITRSARGETVTFGQNAGDLRPIDPHPLPTDRCAASVAPQTSRPRDFVVFSPNDLGAPPQGIDLSGRRVFKLARRCFGPPPKSLPEISGIAEAKSFSNFFHS